MPLTKPMPGGAPPMLQPLPAPPGGFPRGGPPPLLPAGGPMRGPIRPLAPRGGAAAGGGYGKQPVRRACWFCLATPEVEKHLIVSIAGATYVATAKGSVVPQHVLVIPVDHVNCMASLGSEAETEVKKYLKSLTRFVGKG